MGIGIITFLEGDTARKEYKMLKKPKKTKRTYKAKKVRGQVMKNKIDKRLLNGIITAHKRLGDKLNALGGRN